MSLSSDTPTTIVTNPDGIYATTIWFLWYCCRRQLQQLFDSNMPTTISKVAFRQLHCASNALSFAFQSAFVTDIMNSGLMLCIEPDWMDTLYDVHFDQFDVFENLSDQFKSVLHQMLMGNETDTSTDFLLKPVHC